VNFRVTPGPLPLERPGRSDFGSVLRYEQVSAKLLDHLVGSVEQHLLDG